MLQIIFYKVKTHQKWHFEVIFDWNSQNIQKCKNYIQSGAKVYAPYEFVVFQYLLM